MPTMISVSRCVTPLRAYAYRLVWVDANLVGLNVIDHEPSLLGGVVPSRAPLSRSPLIWKVALVETFWLSDGCRNFTTGAPEETGAAAAGAAPGAGAAAAAAPPPTTLTDFHHQPLPPVWAYTFRVWLPPGTE